MDITETLAPKSDQLDAVDLVDRELTFTVTRVTGGPADQPVQVHFAEFPRPWRPGVNMRRVLGALWGKESDAWTGHRITLYCDPTVRFGGDITGGVRIRAMSHIGGKKQSALIMPTKGKTTYYSVDPLPDTEPTITPDTLTELGALFARKGIPAAAHLSGAGKIIGHQVTSLDTITEAEAQRVIGALKQRPDKESNSD